MFIEFNDLRINSEHITAYCAKHNTQNNTYVVWVEFTDGKSEPLSFNTEEEAKHTLYALDRALGVKPVIIRK